MTTAQIELLKLGVWYNSRKDMELLQNKLRNIILKHYSLAEFDNLPLEQKVEYIANSLGVNYITPNFDRASELLVITGYDKDDLLRSVN